MALPIRLINVGIRSVVLLSRFFFLFALAKMLDPAEIGKYGLLVAAVIILIWKFLAYAKETPKAFFGFG
ncbi:hypothetical protein [Stutzerimonas nitrititolerans]|uniref:hypothetical protein n=1 Tax=Stutzerimonas nitrititolerans TaxID=2482751 RepID=UPI0028980A75|nr:hypothetical protein [Stutzerimonas nitrititolerans]